VLTGTQSVSSVRNSLYGSENLALFRCRRSGSFMNCPYNTFGGIRSSGPQSEGRACHVWRATLNVPSPSIGHDERAPPTPWSAAIHRRFSVKALAFTTSPLIRIETEYQSGGTGPSNPCNGRTRSTGFIRAFSGPCSGGTRSWDPQSEGRACHVRSTRIDDPLPFTGHDERAPPTPWSAAIHRRFSVKALAFTTLVIGGALPQPRQAVHR